ncbi:MAG TPA: hypothetical protein VM099_01255 [Gemmatimonadaceae bacterium]|nr:hypothetical protein [Gemmatimonadaceae bacterium]
MTTSKRWLPVALRAIAEGDEPAKIYETNPKAYQGPALIVLKKK